LLQLIIPAYNEELRLPRTLRALRTHVAREGGVPGPVEVIVVDNGSSDRTAQVALGCSSDELPIRVLRCEVRGKGAAVRAGMLATDADAVGFMDADGATSLEALDEAWRLLSIGTEVAIASRGLDGSVTAVRHSWVRERGARAYRSLAASIVPDVVDTQCGLKLLDGALARLIFAQLRTVGFSFDVEMLARARIHGARITEFPAVWTDIPGSTFVPVRHGARSFSDLAHIAWLIRAERAAQPVAAIPAPVSAPVSHPTVSPAVEG
jgi:glycosyltransferase involved in cell wall biosynthesis